VNFLSKVVPAPWLSAALFALWLVLARSMSAGNVLLALGLALAVPHLTSKLRPTKQRVGRPGVMLRFVLTVSYDVLRSNFAVAAGVVATPWRPTRARFVVVPLELRSPLGLAALAMVTTIVPGTVWSELALDRSAMLLHVWDLDDEVDFVARFKARYEKPLQEIFE
jgi:multicomponent K+:H+ antiporter subunit E